MVNCSIGCSRLLIVTFLVFCFSLPGPGPLAQTSSYWKTLQRSVVWALPLACISLTHYTRCNPLFDAVGSLLIGTVLSGVASFIIYTNTMVLIGKSVAILCICSIAYMYFRVYVVRGELNLYFWSITLMVSTKFCIIWFIFQIQLWYLISIFSFYYCLNFYIISKFNKLSNDNYLSCKRVSSKRL